MRYCICFVSDDDEVEAVGHEYKMRKEGEGISFTLADDILDFMDVLGKDPKVVDSFRNYLVDSGIISLF